ncbi:gamma-glutamyltransferase [Allohahella marinimesophila]|uniref:Gamma-glutamyltransferase n=2 Tax=Allohahella marinimesophila TaxID=1054972 RepID=A0ABP7NWJ0_9GAMM
MDQLDRGGSAIDAMLAASAMLSAVFPHMSGLGGDAFWLLHDPAQSSAPDQGVRTIVGVGQAGHQLPEGGRITLRGPASVASTAGALASWKLAHEISQTEWGSNRSWKDLLSGAAETAEQGVEPSISHLFWLGHRKPLIETLPDLDEICRDANGQWLTPGSRFFQRDLATTLRQLIASGIDDFYIGEIAHELATAFDDIGCGLTLADLKATRAFEAAPLSIRYREGRLFNTAPPSQGLYTLQAMGAVGQSELSGLGNGTAAYFHQLVEAIKPALIRRNRQLHDPAFRSSAAVRGWDYQHSLATAQLQAYAQAIDAEHAAPWPAIGQPADTVWMAATDEAGRTACLIQSLFHDFGSGCVLGDSGILWQNRAAGFNADAWHPNAWAPGKRPAHTLNPSCYLADDGSRLFFGTQGGDGQPQTQMVLASQLIDFSTPVEAAIAMPRFLLGRSFFDGGDNLKLEAGVGEATIEGLKALGHDVEVLPQHNLFMGQAGIISIASNGRKEAVHDLRGQINDNPLTSLGQAD